MDVVAVVVTLMCADVYRQTSCSGGELFGHLGPRGLIPLDCFPLRQANGPGSKVL